MRVLSDPLRKYLADQINQQVRSYLGKDELVDIYCQLTSPPDSNMGDLSFGCFQLSKLLKKNPAQIANDIKSKMQTDEKISKIEAVGPYVNFTFTEQFIGEELLKPILSGIFFKTKLTENTPFTMIEFSQPNTHKELHVGHMRNACLGDAVVRLHRYAGYEVVSSTFPGDVGTHVAKCLWYMKFHNQEPIPEEGKGEWLGKLYSKAHIKLEDEVGSSKEQQNREQLTFILKQLESKNGEFYELWKQTRQWSLDLMQRIYNWAGIEFDKWYWESDVDSDSLKYVKELFEEGHLVKSEGAIGMDLEADKLGFCLLLKSDGTGLYATKDLELARKKFQEFKIEKSIYVVDLRQALHFKQVFKVLEKIGFHQAKNCYHLQYNFVELPDGPMSSRKGNIVPLTSLVHRMEDAVKTNYLQRYRGEWSEAEINLVACQVAQGAIKYGMLRMDTNKKIVFEMEEWLKIEGESGPFVQYSSARINSLCKKFNYRGDSKTDWSLLTHVAEHKLMQLLIDFHSVVIGAAENYKPALLCTYLYEVAKKFNLFYHECSIGNAGTGELKSVRLALSYATGEILKKGLALLGIPAPDRM